MELGYSLSSEEFDAPTLVSLAARAERAGFGFASISDHFHPWTDAQGESPFVWGTLGAISQATDELRLLTGVTCPISRIHPAIVAQAAATAASLMPGRFSLGLGSGEKLNEHITSARWPGVVERQAMLEEAIEVIRELWSGKLTSHRGDHFTVENARIYSMPDEAPSIIVAVAGASSVDLAARIGDGIIATEPDGEATSRFREKTDGRRGPAYGQFHVCWAADEASARKTALAQWPNGALTGSYMYELPLPAHFEEAAELLDEDQIADAVVCGPDPAKHIDAIQKFLDAGYEHVSVHQIGSEQEGFFDFYEREVLPHFAAVTT